MVERILAVVGLAGAVLIALAMTGTLQPPLPGAYAAQYCPTDQYGTQYGDCADDSTAPTISSIVTPGPNPNGWNNTNVTLIFNASDEPGGSGVRSITCNLGGTTNGSTRGIVFTAATVNQSITCTATDWAGNVSDPATRTVRIDKVRPTIALLSRLPAPDPYGWNNTDVTVVWSCSDAFSGVVSPTVTRTITTDGANQFTTGTCTDLAGNTLSSGVAVNIDKTAIAPLGGPPNDNVANATVVATLPFVDTTDTTTATRETHEPTCSQPVDDKTVWYRFTAIQSGLVRVSLSGNAPFLDVISVWRPSTSGLSFVSCRVGNPPSTFTAQQGVTYYVRIGGIAAVGAAAGTGPFTVGIALVPPPSNDTFANAKPVGSLPFSDGLDLTAATIEPGEPLHPNGSLSALVRTAWYRFTPTQDETVVLGGTTVPSGASVMAVYTGSTLATLHQVIASTQLIPQGNTNFLFPLVFQVLGGTTYFIQAGTFVFTGGNDVSTIGLERPVVYLGQTPLPNANGWNNTHVTLNWRCSSLFPFGTPTATQALVFDGRNQSATGFCLSPFGSASDTEGGVNIDQTTPTTTFEGQSPPPNANATGTFLSVRSQPGDYIGQGVNQLFSAPVSTFSATLPLGGEFFAAQVSPGFFVNIAAPPGMPLAVGHYANAVRAEFRPPGVPGLDVFGQGRGCNEIAGSFDVTQISFTPSGDLLMFDATFEQHCEIFGPALFGRIRIDNSNPTAPALLGWNNTDVTLTWSCSDSLSGVSAPSASTTLSAEGASQSGTGTCADLAGNSSSDTEGGIGIDKTPPNAPTALADRTPEYAGGGSWFVDAVTVHFADNGDPNGANGTSGSGVDSGSIPAPVTFTTDGSHTTSGTVKDLAGNESAPASLTVQVDATAPALSATFATADGSAYVTGTWTNQAVTATFQCTDTGGSGVASSSSPQSVLTQGTNQFVVGNCTDNVGHTTTQAFGGIDIDLTPPEGYLVFDPATRDLRLFGRDQGGSSVQSGPFAPATASGKGSAQVRTYTVADGAGNTLVLVLQVKPSDGAIQASVSSLRYNGGSTVTAPFTVLAYTWSLNKDGSFKQFEQDLQVGKGKSQQHVDALYTGKKDSTTITSGSTTTTVAGLTLLRIATSSGALVIEF